LRSALEPDVLFANDSVHHLIFEVASRGLAVADQTPLKNLELPQFRLARSTTLQMLGELPLLSVVQQLLDVENELFFTFCAVHGYTSYTSRRRCIASRSRA